MSQTPNREKAIFLQALEQKTARERSEFLDEACADDSELRQRVEELLSSSDDAAGFMDGHALEHAALDEPFETIAPMGALVEGLVSVIGPYKLLEQIGEGGFGIVFVAEQQEPVRRRVAVKLIKPGMDSRDVINRFEAERQALALMDHPNIARVLDAGATDSGRPYFVMELVRGIPITEYCDQSQLSLNDRLALFASVCRAVQHAHQKGIIHRDVKPSNVLVTLHDGEPVVKVIDFGVAKALNQQLSPKTVYTKFSQMIGTPLYMSPEQAELSGLDVDTRSDIYSLGVLLYELLTGSTPFDRKRLTEAAFDEFRRIIREEEPPKPSTRLSNSGDRLALLAAQRNMEPAKLSRVMCGELDWIVMKALEKDRNRRDETANAFAADILRYLSNDAVEACPPTAGYRLKKFARRNKTFIATSALIATVLIVGTIVSTWQAVNASRAKSKAKQSADLSRESAAQARESFQRASASERELRERIYAADMNIASEAYAAGAINRMNDLLENHRDDGQRGLEWFHWWRAGHLERAKARHPRDGSFSHMAVSPDGKTIALSAWPRHLFLYDSETLCLLHPPIQIKGQGSQTCFSPDGDFLLVDGVDGEWRSIGVRVLDTKSWETVATLESGRDNVMAFAMNQPRLAIASLDQIRLWTWVNASWELQKGWRTTGRVRELAMTPDGKVLIARMTGALESAPRIDVWDVEAQKSLGTINDGQILDAIALSPDGNMLAVAARSGDVYVWALSSLAAADQPSAIQVLPTSGRISSLAFSPDARHLVAGAYSERNLIVWDVEGDDFGPPITIRAHSREVTAIGFGTDSNTLYSAANDGYLKVWDLSRCQPYDTIPGVDPKSQVGYVDDNTLIFNDQEGIIQRWDVRSCEWNTPLDKQNKYYRIALSDNGEFLAGVTRNNELRVWNLTDGRLVHKTPVNAESDCRLVVSRNGRRVAYTVTGKGPIDAGFGNTLLIRFGKNEVQKTNPDRFLHRLNFDRWRAFSPDGNQLVIQRSGFTKHNSHLLDITADPIEQRYQLEGWGPELCAAFSRDGSMLAIGSVNYDIRIHDAASGELKHTLRGHTDPPRSLAFSQDGSRLVSAGFDSTVRIWKVGPNECRLLSTLHGHSSNIEFVTVSPEGTSIASVGADGSLLVWRTSAPGEVEKNNLQALSQRGQSHLAASDWDAAVADFDQALERFQDNHYFIQMRADAHAQAGRLQESLDDWTKLVQLTDSANAEYLYRRGECNIMLGRREDAGADLLRAMSVGLSGLGQSAALLQRIESSLLLSRSMVPNGAAWRYSTDRPPDSWNAPDYEDSSWRVGAAPFGTRIFCKTIWSNSPDIWLRTTFELDREMDAPLILRVLADDKADVYLNGVFAAHVAGSTETYMTVECSSEARLRRGENTIAVHCLDEGWDAAAIDVGLYVQGDSTTFGKLLAAADERNPNIRKKWIQHLVDHGRLEEAAAAVGKLVQMNPADEMIRMQAAILYAHDKDLDRFHRHSQESLQIFAETESPSIAERIAKACLVAPPLEADLPGIRALADKALTLEPQGDRFIPWAQLTKALCEYRLGNAQAAIEWAEKCHDHADNQVACKSLSLGMLAMAHARLQHRDAAINAEAEFTQLLDERSPLRTKARPGNTWHDWLIGELFLRELRRAQTGDR